MRPKLGDRPKTALLLVDADAVSRLRSVGALAERYRVIEAESLEAAAEILAQSEDVDLIVTDLDLVGYEDGLLLLERVKQLAPHCACLLLRKAGDARLGDGLADVAVVRPLLPGDLEAAVVRAIAARGETP